jgi:hypothetical protein
VSGWALEHLDWIPLCQPDLMSTGWRPRTLAAGTLPEFILMQQVVYPLGAKGKVEVDASGESVLRILRFPSSQTIGADYERQ